MSRARAMTRALCRDMIRHEFHAHGSRPGQLSALSATCPLGFGRIWPSSEGIREADRAGGHAESLSTSRPTPQWSCASAGARPRPQRQCGAGKLPEAAPPVAVLPQGGGTHLGHRRPVSTALALPGTSPAALTVLCARRGSTYPPAEDCRGFLFSTLLRAYVAWRTTAMQSFHAEERC